MLDFLICLQLYLIVVIGGVTVYGIMRITASYSLVSTSKKVPSGDYSDIRNLLRSYNANLAKSTKKGKSQNNTESSNSGGGMVDMIGSVVKILPDVMPLVEKFITKPPEKKK